ncbi:hypothetical protein GUJ93_ZPchr0010g7334 [Zizania palustris]|uniref:Uncharacterized protein n=1 Tax=Zizania palustris TaxID=103762 RepID=A0A8J5TM72_ZIZPA|nr:hypothetical protein GUJ93_ZPchr0010g7334 [Zizania palustris]
MEGGAAWEVGIMPLGESEGSKRRGIVLLCERRRDRSTGRRAVPITRGSERNCGSGKEEAKPFEPTEPSSRNDIVKAHLSGSLSGNVSRICCSAAGQRPGVRLHPIFSPKVVPHPPSGVGAHARRHVSVTSSALLRDVARRAALEIDEQHSEFHHASRKQPTSRDFSCLELKNLISAALGQHCKVSGERERETLEKSSSSAALIWFWPSQGLGYGKSFSTESS